MKPTLKVIKLGGNCMDNATQLHAFLEQFAEIAGPKILVHGGGKIASSIGRKLGIEPKMIEGRRMTDESTIELVTMVYAGLLNKKIVAELQSYGCNAVGFCGADGNLVKSSMRNPEPVNYGLVGDPVSVNDDLLIDLTEKNYVPVISPVTHDAHGQLLNTNADTIASVIAIAMTDHYTVHLLYAFDKNGVLDDPENDASVIPEITRQAFNDLRAAGKIHSGMLPKLSAGFRALEKNVARVSIINQHNLHHPQPSTILSL